MEFARACACACACVRFGDLGSWMEGATKSQGLKDRGCRIAPSLSRRRCWARVGWRRWSAAPRASPALTALAAAPAPFCRPPAPRPPLTPGLDWQAAGAGKFESRWGERRRRAVTLNGVGSRTRLRLPAGEPRRQPAARRSDEPRRSRAPWAATGRTGRSRSPRPARASSAAAEAGRPRSA